MRANLMGRQLAQLRSKVGEEAHLDADHLAKLLAVAATTDPAEAPELFSCRGEEMLPRFDLALQSIARHLSR